MHVAAWPNDVNNMTAASAATTLPPTDSWPGMCSRCPISTEHSCSILFCGPRAAALPNSVPARPPRACERLAHTIGHTNRSDHCANYAIMRPTQNARENAMQSAVATAARLLCCFFFLAAYVAAAVVARHPRRFECAIKIWVTLNYVLDCRLRAVRCDWAVYVPSGSISAKCFGRECEQFHACLGEKSL